jgi:hypothetical protein
MLTDSAARAVLAASVKDCQGKVKAGFAAFAALEMRLT